MSLRYYFLPNKFKVFVNIGLINQYEITKEEYPRNNYIENNYSLNGKLGAGIEYNLNSNFAIQTIAEYNNGLTNIFRRSDFKIRTISFGLGVVKKI